MKKIKVKVYILKNGNVYIGENEAHKIYDKFKYKDYIRLSDTEQMRVIKDAMVHNLKKMTGLYTTEYRDLETGGLE